MRQLSSRVVYRNAWMTVREDEVEQPDGSPGIYGVVDKPDFAVVVPRDGEDFWMVEQHRYPVGRRTLEFPMGGWPPGRSGPPADLARAELAELVRTGGVDDSTTVAAFGLLLVAEAGGGR